MAYEMPFKSITLVPKVDMTANRYAFVTVDATGKAVIATAAGNAIGALQDPNNIDQPANVMVSGVTFAVADGTIAAGDVIEVGALGKAKKHSSGTVVGIALVGGASGAVVSVLLK